MKMFFHRDLLEYGNTSYIWEKIYFKNLKKVRETLYLEYSKGKNIMAGFLSDIDSSPG